MTARAWARVVTDALFKGVGTIGGIYLFNSWANGTLTGNTLVNQIVAIAGLTIGWVWVGWREMRARGQGTQVP